MAHDPALDAVLSRLDADRRRRRVVLSTSADRAAEVLREQVVEGLLRSGSRLPEEPLARALGVSRNTLREALSQLVAERILTREPYRGVVVSTPGPEDLADVYRARLVLEPAAVLAGRAHDAERLAAVRQAVEEGRSAEERQDWVGVGSANQHFHRALVGLAGSVRLDAQMDLLLAEMRLFFNQMAHPEEFHRPYLAENAEIAALLARGRRTEAAARLVTYLEQAERQLTSALAGR